MRIYVLYILNIRSVHIRWKFIWFDEITVTISRGGPDIVVSRARVTLQGLVTDQKAFTYAHRLEMPNVSNRNGEGMDIDVKIVDVSVHDNAVFVLHGYGYRLLPDGVSSS